MTIDTQIGIHDESDAADVAWEITANRHHSRHSLLMLYDFNNSFVKITLYIRAQKDLVTPIGP